jgi:hypothetical protein
LISIVFQQSLFVHRESAFRYLNSGTLANLPNLQKRSCPWLSLSRNLVSPRKLLRNRENLPTTIPAKTKSQRKNLPKLDQPGKILPRKSPLVRRRQTGVQFLTIRLLSLRIDIGSSVAASTAIMKRIGSAPSRSCAQKLPERPGLFDGNVNHICVRRAFSRNLNCNSALL